MLVVEEVALHGLSKIKRIVSPAKRKIIVERYMFSHHCNVGMEAGKHVQSRVDRCGSLHLLVAGRRNPRSS